MLRVNTQTADVKFGLGHPLFDDFEYDSTVYADEETALVGFRLDGVVEDFDPDDYGPADYSVGTLTLEVA